MEKALREYLRENEQICWHGKPAHFQMMDQGSRSRILLKWILTAAIAGGLLVMYLMSNEVPSMGFIGLVCLVSLVIIASPFAEYRNLKGEQYWITDQRAILMTRDKTFYYMELSDIDTYKVIRDMAADDCLVLGGCLFEEVHKQLRWRACHPKIDIQAHENPDRALGMIFYCIQNADAAVSLLEQNNPSRAA